VASRKLARTTTRRALAGARRLERNRRQVGAAPAAEQPTRWSAARTSAAAMARPLGGSRSAFQRQRDAVSRFSRSKQDAPATRWTHPSCNAFCEGAGLPRARTTFSIREIDGRKRARTYGRGKSNTNTTQGAGRTSRACGSPPRPREHPKHVSRRSWNQDGDVDACDDKDPADGGGAV